MIKAVFFDIDGTLITHTDQSMPKSCKKALQLLHDKGIEAYICTGRPYSMTSFLKDYFEFDGFATTNGQYCVNKEGEVIYEAFMDNQDIRNLVKYLNETGTTGNIVCKNNIYNNGSREKMGTFTKDFHEVLDQDVYQVMLDNDTSQDEEILSLMPNSKSQRWTDMFMDVVPASGGKNRGIDAIINHYNIKLEETMGFGDGENDILMLEHAHIGVAMGNSNDKVKASSDYVTTDIDDDGVYNALKHFKII